MKDRSLAELLETLSGPTATPGGGSAAAIAGAVVAALTRMVAGLALGKRGYEDAQEDLRRATERAAELESRLLALADEDSTAYEAVVVAMRRPRSTDAERVARVEAIQAATRVAAEVPLRTVEACVEVLGLSADVAEKGNRSATTDAGVAAILAEAAARGAALNVRVNLQALTDEEFRDTSEERVRGLLAEAERQSKAALEIVGKRL